MIVTVFRSRIKDEGNIICIYFDFVSNVYVMFEFEGPDCIIKK